MDRLVPVWLAGSDALSFTGWACLAFGLGFALLGMVQLWVKGKGLPISHLPPSQFVSNGIYKHFRHPIYLGYTVAFAGLSLVLRSFWSLAFSTPLLILGWLGYCLFYEEPLLLDRYGESYREYCYHTPFFIPKSVGKALERAVHPVLRNSLSWLNRLADWTVFFRRGPVILVSYGIFIGLGAFISMVHISSLFLLQGVGRREVAFFLAGLAIMTFLFAHIFWWAGHWKEARRQPMLGLKLVGFVSYGALFGIVMDCLAFSLVFGYSALFVLDVAVRGMYIAYAIGRIGCLTYGCCWGKAAANFGIIYRNPEAKVVRLNGLSSVARHPAPVYSAIEGLLLFIILNMLSSIPLPPGFLTVLGFLIYPVGRAFIEAYRERRWHLGDFFNEGHVACAVMFSAGVALLFLLSPGVGLTSPRPWNPGALAQSFSLIPLVLGLSGLLSFVTSFHWRRLGTW
jgi:prolipoprotein diacylglyceryltransferase